MIGKSQKISGKLLASVAAVSLAIMPMIVYADASAPGAVKVHHKKPAAHKRKHRAKAVAHRTVAQPTQVAQAEPAPVYQAPAPEPAPVAAPEPAPMPAPAPAAPAPAPAPVMAEHHGSGALLGILGAAAVIGGIIAVASGGSPASP